MLLFTRLFVRKKVIIILSDVTESHSEEPSLTQQEPSLTQDLFQFIFVGFLFLGLALFLQQSLGSDTRDWLLELRELLQGSGTNGGLWTSSAIFVIISGAAISLGVPRLWVSGAAGALYGVLLGIVVATVASMIGALTVYLAGRRLLGAVVKRRFKGQFIMWRERFQQNAFWWVLYVRLFPLSNSTLTNLLCGSCRVPLRDYLWASFIGFLPLTFVFAAFGSGGIKGNLNQVLLGLCLLLTAIIIRLLFITLQPKSIAKS